jgi:hypothetical protein
MSKTKRRKIKKRNTRRRNYKMLLQTRTKYTNNKRKYKNTNRKTRNRRSQRGGELFFVGINDKTGKYIYYSDELKEIIEITPLPVASTTKAHGIKQRDQQIIAEMAIAGIQDVKGMAPIPDVDRYVAKHKLRAMPKAGDISVPEYAIKAKQYEKDKQYTMLMAQQQVNKRMEEFQDMMFDSPSVKGKKPSYLSDDETEYGISPMRARTPAVSSLAKSSGFKSMHLSSSAKRKEQPRQSLSSGSEDDLDLGGEEADDGKRQLKQPNQGAVARGRPKSPYEQRNQPLFLLARGAVDRRLDADIEERLEKVFGKVDGETQKMIRESPQCLKNYILFRLEGEGITKEMIRKLYNELKDGTGSQLRSLLVTHNLFPIPESLWVPDGVCKRSAIGGEEFGVFTRRHHCRCCGRCITSKYYVDSLKVCTECDRILTRM